MSKKNPLIKLFLEAAAESGDPDRIEMMLRELTGLVAPMFALYILVSVQEHTDHDDCEVIKKIPASIDNFLKEFSDDVRMHVELNLKVNGIDIAKSHNRQVYDDIMESLKQAE